MTLLDEILNIFFPERCISCAKQGSALCAICERNIITKPIALSKTTATLFDYQNPLVKKAIWALKYSKRRSLGRYFGTALYREFFKQLAYGEKKTTEEILIIPIPASFKALSTRGYNHAGVIAKTIVQNGKEDGLDLVLRDDLLFKKREVGPQAQTRRKSDRKKNVYHVFDIKNGETITGKTVILIDDVITTGATITEAKRVLKPHHPKRILALAVAH